jgi:hypothetical protein
LEPSEAEAVTRILERLSQETSDSVLIGEADFWFELDAEIDGLIGAAGFDEATWRRAYDETLAGLLAGIEQAEFDATIAAPMEMLAASPHLTEAQKAEILSDFQVSMDELARRNAPPALRTGTWWRPMRTGCAGWSSTERDGAAMGRPFAFRRRRGCRRRAFRPA